ncbi:hypothetical protein [Laspinema olomoucense]|uniref:hypothetical protein n=1 Tax=Laspinema olomoucense TaxID=3231600 RepID=UPI0021BAD87E|nr:hypothetical protein [Laspinema sp. D3c]MCT7994079.1 hypothetical protein [Laspinema sp. D3c]
MTYNLNFAIKFKKEGEYIVYDRDSFTQGAIRISVPDIVTIFDKFIQQSFETTGLLDQPPSKVKDANLHQEEKVQGKVTVFEEQSVPKTTIQSLSGEVYYCQTKKIKDTIAFQEFKNDLAEYLHKSLSRINSDNLLKEETNVFISGIKEVLEVRNYLVTYTTNSSKKQYKEGYLYVMKT